jgi:acyl-homoserine-lactone acylase
MMRGSWVWVRGGCMAAVAWMAATGLGESGRVSADEAGEEALAAQVTIRRDKFGVPHILAPTEQAAAFGHGYATAEDHVLALARLLLKARSEEAAYFGDRFAASDLLVKKLHMHEGAAAGYAKSPPWVQRILDGYTAGYNYYVRRHRGELPGWVQPASAVDLLAHGRRVVLMEFSMNLGQLNRIGNKRSAQLPSGTEETALARGSNMWAIGKERSASGRALLLGNPHLGWEGSQIWCEAQITVPGRINMYGATLIGSPVLTIGFNDHLGWSHTVNLHDSDDVYELTLDPARPHHYIYDGKPVPLKKETITIQVKTDSGLKSANLHEHALLEQWNLMAKARNLSEFRRVLDMQALPMFNICYADREGNCFYLFNGRFPDRPSGFNWEGVVPGNTSATEWNHVLPQYRLPALVNPRGGYVQNCNSSPWYTNLQELIDRQRFPEISLEKMLRYKYNTRLLLADRVKDDLLKAIRGGNGGEGAALAEAADLLEQWDNTVSRQSTGSMLFTTFWKKYGRMARRPYREDWDEHRPASTPAGLGEPSTARQALAEAIKEMKQKYGTLAVAWGDVHRLRRGRLDVPIGGYVSEYRDGFSGAPFGDFGAFRIVRYHSVDKDGKLVNEFNEEFRGGPLVDVGQNVKDGKLVAHGGDSFVFAVEFTTPPTAYSIVAYSQSDDPRSPHHTDQSELFAQEKWKQVWFTEEEIARNLERSYHP